MGIFILALFGPHIDSLMQVNGYTGKVLAITYNTRFLFYKQPVYKQLGLGLSKQ